MNEEKQAFTENRALVHLDTARKALSLAKGIDEVKDIRDKAEALRVYAKQAGYGLEVQNGAAELKLRAERRAGEMLAEVERSEGGRPSKNSFHDETSYQKTLRENELSLITAHRWQLEAGVPEDGFERYLAETKNIREELTSIGLRNLAIKQQRLERKREPSELPEGVFNVIYADPPWQYSNVLRQWGPAELHYPTMTIDEICNVKIPSADDAVLFLWVTNPFLRDAFQVIDAWGFEYKTNMVWVKTGLKRPGSGFWVRGRHELLFICSKGSFLPDQTDKEPIGSVITYDVQEHSRKPKIVYEIIEKMYPNGKYLELFARDVRGNWESWGDELNTAKGNIQQGNS